MGIEMAGNNYQQLCISLLALIESLGYEKKTISAYQRELNKIAEFMDKTKASYYSAGLGERYLAEYVSNAHTHKSSINMAETVVRRLDDLLFGEIRFYRHAIGALQCPECFTEQLDRYTQYLRHRGNRESTIKARKQYCVQFLDSIEKNGVSVFATLHPKHIHQAFMESNSKGGFRQAVAPFLKYLFKEGILDDNLSECIPYVRRPQPMPSVYSEDEIDKLLSGIDKTLPNGKRDYAILVIASQLGLRASDISGLSLNNIDFQTKTIHLTQQKTGTAIRVALLQDIEEALRAYIDSVCPASKYDKIFLRRRAPRLPLSAKSIYAIVSQHFHESGIKTRGKKRGPHSLRMSLATKLLAENVPYAAIQKILGHEDPNSTKHYARMDTEMLRRCALEIPQPSGLFAKRLDISERGAR